MNWQEIAVTVLPEAVEAVADCFYELGSGGVVIEDPALLKTRINEGQWDAYTLPEEMLRRSLPVVKGYFPVDEELSIKLEELKNGIGEIMLRLGKESPETVQLGILQEEDWANSWKVFFKPFKLGDQVVIKPSWESYAAMEGEIILEMDPGMAFGTGTHLTTTMCAFFLEKYLHRGDRVLDVGTGTGILAMIAAVKGARSVLALDYDRVAVQVAVKNIRQNGLEGLITVIQNDLLAGVGEQVAEQADLIVANIVADVILRLLPQVKTRLRRDGLFLASGIIKERRAEVLQAAETGGFILIEEQIKGEWVAQAWQLKEDRNTTMEREETNSTRMWVDA